MVRVRVRAWSQWLGLWVRVRHGDEWLGLGLGYSGISF